MFTDESRDKAWNDIRQHGVRAFAKLLTPEVVSEAASQAKVKIGRSALNLVGEEGRRGAQKPAQAHRCAARQAGQGAGAQSQAVSILKQDRLDAAQGL